VADSRPAVGLRALASLRALTGVRFSKQEQWELWWQREREGFVFPEGEQKVDAEDEGMTRAVYNGIRVTSDHVAFLIDKSADMNARLKSRDSLKKDAALEELRCT
jgi:hypothetical protein